MPKNAAIYYEAECYDTHQEFLMGRNAAGEGFLRGFVKHSGVDKFYCHAGDLMAFGKQMTDLSGAESIEIEEIKIGEAHRLSEVGCLYVPDPRLSEHAWRRWQSGADYSLCGVTHTLCSITAMDAVVASMMAPCMPWDALVCTSKCAKNVVDRLYEAQHEYIDRRFGAENSFASVVPQTPVIPLGVDCSLYEHSDEHRKVWRERLNIKDEDFVFLNFGRLSYHAKSNPLPMFDALEQVAKDSDKKIYLILAGWFADPRIASDFQYAAMELCPSVNIRAVDGRAPDARFEIWSAADAFISLSDNYQETFGLVLLEAMAVGLPVIASNWSGYQDIVVQGETGLLVQVLANDEAATGNNLIQRYSNGEIDYDHYIGYLSQFVGVSIGDTVQACRALVSDAGLCKRLGDFGRARALAHYDWSAIITQYQELWADLAKMRFTSRRVSPSRRPARLDPYQLFEGYSCERFSTCAVRPDAEELVEKRRKLGIVSFAESELPCQETVQELLKYLRTDDIGYALSHAKGARQRDLIWLHKIGAIELK